MSARARVLRADVATSVLFILKTPLRHTIICMIVIAGSCLLLPGAAHAACTSPAKSAGAIEWFSADQKFKYCDNTNWVVIGTGGSWVVSGSDIYYNTDMVGINRTNPVVMLDVGGSVRMGDNNVTCTAAHEGAMRYSSVNTVDFCDGTSWKSFAGVTPSTCPTTEYTTPGSYTYTVTAGCTNLILESYGAGGGGGWASYAGGGGGSSRIEYPASTIVSLGGGGGGGGGDAGGPGGGGGGGYGKKLMTLSVGNVLNIYVGQGGQNGCSNNGGAGGNPSGGTLGNNSNGGNSTYGGGGGGDGGYRGGTSTYGGGGGGGDGVDNNGSTTTYGGAGGADLAYLCGTSTYGGPCSGSKSGGGGGFGIGDVALQGSGGNNSDGGTAAGGGTGTGGAPASACNRGGDGKVVIRPQQ